jgi:hypothetical protein
MGAKYLSAMATSSFVRMRWGEATPAQGILTQAITEVCASKIEPCGTRLSPFQVPFGSNRTASACQNWEERFWKITSDYSWLDGSGISAL